MSKLINNPRECGWRVQLETRLGLHIGYTCRHSSKVIGSTSCNKGTEFPTDCPLKDGTLINTVEFVVKT